MTRGALIRDLGLPCGAFLLLATVNAAVIPWFEFPDEKNHIHYAQFVARTGSLPPMLYAPLDDGETTVRVAFNPPLYYLLASRFLDSRTPFVSPQVAYAPRPPRGFPDPPRCGWDKLGDLPARLSALRCLSVLFGLVAVLGCWCVGRALRPWDPSLAAAMAWVPVCIPQFVSMSAAINNEGLAVALAALATVACVRSAATGRASTAGLSGLLLGAAAMSKISAVVLAPALALAVLRGRGGWMRAVAFTVTLICVAGPWVFRNAAERGDPTGIKSIEAVEANRCAGRHPTDPVGIARGAAVAGATFYLDYGQLAIHLPRWGYLFPAAGALVALLGWRRASREAPDVIPFGPSAWIAVASLAAAFVAYNLRVFSLQCRYLYVGMAFMAYIVARGLLAWVPPVRRTLAVTACGALMAAGQLAHLLAVVSPAYRG